MAKSDEIRRSAFSRYSRLANDLLIRRKKTSGADRLKVRGTL